MRSVVLDAFAFAFVCLAIAAAGLAIELATGHNATLALLEVAITPVPLAAAMVFISRKEVLETTVAIRPTTFTMRLEPPGRTVTRAALLLGVFAVSLIWVRAPGVMVGMSAWVFIRALRLRALEQRTGRRLLRPSGRRRDRPGGVYAA